MVLPRRAPGEEVGVANITSSSSCFYDVTPKEKIRNDTEKTCFIKIVLPSQDDELTSSMGRRSPEISHISPETATPKDSEDPSHTTTELSSRIVSSNSNRDADSSETGIVTDIETGPEKDKDHHKQMDREKDLTTALLDMYSSKIRRPSLDLECSNRFQGVTVCTVKQNVPRRTNPPPRLLKRSEVQNKSNVADRQKTANVSGSFVDIAGWQTELQNSPKSDLHNLQQKLPKANPSASKGFKGNLGERPFIFDHHEDLTRYIQDYRTTHTIGRVAQKQSGDATLHDNNQSSTGSQRSTKRSNFRVKTTDPNARTFLPQTQRNSAGGCMLCEKEKFRLRNSFPKRVYLSWSQYMTLCKSNSFLGPHEHNVFNPLNSAIRQSTSRAMTSYSATRPLLPMNKQDTSDELKCKYVGELLKAQTDIANRKKMQNDNTGTVADKTLLMYRLSGKRKNSLSSGKSDSHCSDHNGLNTSLQ